MFDHDQAAVDVIPIPTHELLVTYRDSYIAWEAYSKVEAEEIWVEEVAKGALQTALFRIIGHKRMLVRTWDRTKEAVNVDYYTAMREVAKLQRQLKESNGKLESLNLLVQRD